MARKSNKDQFFKLKQEIYGLNSTKIAKGGDSDEDEKAGQVLDCLELKDDPSSDTRPNETELPVNLAYVKAGASFVSLDSSTDDVKVQN